MDDTLIQTPEYNFYNGVSHLLDLPNVGNIGIINRNNYVTITYLRPYIKQLLDYCYKNFNVSFWTAGNYTYCHEILKIILSDSAYSDAGASL